MYTLLFNEDTISRVFLFKKKSPSILKKLRDLEHDPYATVQKPFINGNFYLKCGRYSLIYSIDDRNIYIHAILLHNLLFKMLKSK